MGRMFALITFVLSLFSQALFVLWLFDLGPLGINRGETSTWLAALSIDAGLIATFAFLHSLLARPAVKQWLGRHFTAYLERARYTFVASAGLLAIIWLWSPLPALVWQVSLTPAVVAIYALAVIGALLLAWSMLTIDLLYFSGVKQAFSKNVPEPPFAIKGPYRVVRHPIQTGVLLLVWSTPDMSVGRFFLASLFTVYSVLATLMLEERDLMRLLGARYEEYRRHVPALIPRLPGLAIFKRR